MSIAVNVGGAWKDGTPEKVNVGGVWKSVTVVKENVGGVWKDVFPEANIPPYLYDVNIVYQGNRVVDFTALSGSVHLDPEDESYLFRCTEFPALNGYVRKSFTKTFPVSAYSKLNCQLEDVSSDTLLANAKTISFTVENK